MYCASSQSYFPTSVPWRAKMVHTFSKMSTLLKYFYSATCSHQFHRQGFSGL
uniref:Uncharacterized protein n=1 Tax=Anguilla anguilla TaxID=7936 RepID=A0A0E9PUT8_ANGAN